MKSYRLSGTGAATRPHSTTSARVFKCGTYVETQRLSTEASDSRKSISIQEAAIE